jgi:hypothetical protein
MKNTGHLSQEVVPQVFTCPPHRQESQAAAAVPRWGICVNRHGSHEQIERIERIEHSYVVLRGCYYSLEMASK